MSYILASTSPRRKELLKKIVTDFTVVDSGYNEQINGSISPSDTAEYLAIKKGQNVRDKFPDDIIISADTLIVFNNKIYGKPSNKEEAKLMLKAFSNNTHLVITGVCIISKNKTLSFSSVNEVTFYNLNDKEIDDYLADDEYKDKAGSYAIQGKGGLFIKEIKGDYNSIIGLPISKLNRILKEHFS